MNIYKLFSQILLTVTILATFVGVLFFTYGKNVEKEIIIKESTFIAESLANDIKIFLTKDAKEVFAVSLVAPDMTEADANVEAENKKITSKAFSALTVVFFVGLVLTYIFAFFGQIPLMFVVIEGMVILVFVAVTEIFFLNMIAKNYMLSDPNFVKKTVFETLKTEFVPEKYSLRKSLSKL